MCMVYPSKQFWNSFFFLFPKLFFFINSTTFSNLSQDSNLYMILPTFLCSGGGLLAFAETRPFSGSDSVPKKKVVVLGTGWAGTSFLKNLKSSTFEVQVVSPRNYFAFTPLLPSVTCGTVEARSIVEPIRNIVRKVECHQTNLHSLTYYLIEALD